MSEKCTRYEALFTFSNEETLLKHIEECDDCKKEHEKMQKVSELISEVKPYYNKCKKNSVRLKAACFVFALMIGFASLGVLDISLNNKYAGSLSADELGFPVDAYGFLAVE